MPHAMDTPTTPPTLALRLATAAITAGATVVAVFALGRASSSALMHAVLVLATMGTAVTALAYGLRDRQEVRPWAVGGILVTLAVGVVAGGLLSRATTVDEEVVMAGPVPVEREAQAGNVGAPGDAMARDAAPRGNTLVASGRFQPLEHAGRGAASIVRTPDGRAVLTLTEFRTDAGPDLVVMLVPGNPTDDRDVERAETVTLGRLKGTSGDQQYVLPKGTDPDEFTHAYVWCRAFSVGFTRAKPG